MRRVVNVPAIQSRPDERHRTRQWPISASPHRTTAFDAVGDGPDLVSRLAGSLRDVPPDAPIVIMIHGYRFHPEIAEFDPHRLLFSHRPDRTGWKIRSWPGGLGFDEHDGRSGLAIGFAWPARERHLPSLLRQRRTGFASVYDRAALYGRHLADLIGTIQTACAGTSDRRHRAFAGRAGRALRVAARRDRARADDPAGRGGIRAAGERARRVRPVRSRRRSTTSRRAPTISTT